MSKIKDGGQAFPSAPPLPFDTGLRFGESGMSYRDWLAGQALAGIAAAITQAASIEGGGPLREAIGGAGNLAFAFADSVLAAREGGAL